MKVEKISCNNSYYRD